MRKLLSSAPGRIYQDLPTVINKNTVFSWSWSLCLLYSLSTVIDYCASL